MLLAYFDDSSESGVLVFASVIIEDSTWMQAFDAWLDYRRWLRSNFGLPQFRGTGKTRKPVELKASHFATGAGPWFKLGISPAARLRAYRVGLRLIGSHARVFAVAWVPTRLVSASYTPFHVAPAVDCWRTALERLATYSSYSAGGQRVLTFIDSGYRHLFTRVFRKMRRYHRVGSMQGGVLSAAAPMLVDDPIEKDSKESAFIQMADLCAYAALRELVPRAGMSGLWSAIGAGVLRDVNKYKKDQPPGIKLLPP